MCCRLGTIENVLYKEDNKKRRVIFFRDPLSDVENSARAVRSSELKRTCFVLQHVTLAMSIFFKCENNKMRNEIYLKLLDFIFNNETSDSNIFIKEINKIMNVENEIDCEHEMFFEPFLDIIRNYVAYVKEHGYVVRIQKNTLAPWFLKLLENKIEKDFFEESKSEITEIEEEYGDVYFQKVEEII